MILVRRRYQRSIAEKKKKKKHHQLETSSLFWWVIPGSLHLILITESTRNHFSFPRVRALVLSFIFIWFHVVPPCSYFSFNFALVLFWCTVFVNNSLVEHGSASSATHGLSSGRKMLRYPTRCMTISSRSDFPNHIVVMRGQQRTTNNGCTIGTNAGMNAV